MTSDTDSQSLIGEPSAELNIADPAFPICQNCVMSPSITIHHNGVLMAEASASGEFLAGAEGKKMPMFALCLSAG